MLGSAGSCSLLSRPTSTGTAVAVTAAALALAAQTLVPRKELQLQR